MCYMEPNCVSINVGPFELGKHKCELNNATEENHLTFLLEKKPGYTYIAIEVTFHILIQTRLLHNECDVFLLVTQAYSDKVKKIRVLPTGVDL